MENVSHKDNGIWPASCKTGWLKNKEKRGKKRPHDLKLSVASLLLKKTVKVVICLNLLQGR